MHIRTRLCTIAAAGVALTAPLAAAVPVPAAAAVSDAGTDGDTSGSSAIITAGQDGNSADVNVSTAPVFTALSRFSKTLFGSSKKVCTLNGKPAPVENGVVEGTNGDDIIRCPPLTSLTAPYGMVGYTGPPVESVDGLAGNDTITMSGGLIKRTVRGGEGDDTIRVTTYVEGSYQDKGQILGGDGNDTITVPETKTNSIINGDRGNDTIRIREANSGTIDGGDGDDRIRVGKSFASIYGGPGDDRIEGLNGDRMDNIFPYSYTSGDEGTDTCIYGNDLGAPTGGVTCEIKNPA